MTACTSAAACPEAARYLRTAIVAHDRIATDTWRFRLDCPEIAARAIPGQFAMLRIPGRSDPLLGRPLAVYDVVDDGGRPRWADFVYAVHGRFTTALARLRPGDELTIWGPLGNGFSLPAGDLLLVAGGIGQTALLMLAKHRLEMFDAIPGGRGSAGVVMCWGARHAGLFGGIDDFRRAGCDVHQATLDGSAGLRGTVVDLLDDRFPGDTTARPAIACCGPESMMAAVARWAADRGFPCQVSLETPMACGIGACFTCVARIRDDAGGWDYRRTCLEGPVFDAAAIVW